VKQCRKAESIESNAHRKSNLKGFPALLLLALGIQLIPSELLAAPSSDCEVTYRETWRGGDGFGAGLVIRNSGAPIEGWQLEFDLPGGQRISQGWPVRFSQAAGSEHVVASSNAEWNTRIASGQTLELGFNGSANGSSGRPESFKLNGVECSAGSFAAAPNQEAARGSALADGPTRSRAQGSIPDVSAAPRKVAPATGSPNALFRVAPSGRITKNGQAFPVRCASWFGLEGRHEPPDDPTNPGGAPMELYIGNTFWANGNQGTGRTIEQTMREIVSMGLNVIRLPVSPQTLRQDSPQGRGNMLKNHQSVRVPTARQALEEFIVLADQNGLEIMLDVHSCSNYVGWRAGRLDARPPYVDADRDSYEFTREDWSCAARGNPSSVREIQAYDKERWLDDLRALARLGSDLGVDNIIGIDVFNEPWDYTWSEWKSLVESAFAAIDPIAPNLLVFVQGISASAGHQDGSPDSIVEVPHGDPSSNPNWGENLFEAASNPIDIPKDRLVFSPHTYGPSVFVQRMFMDPSQPQCRGLEGDAAGDAKCNLQIDPSVLRAGWDEHFGFLRDQGYAVVVGEFGGNLDWPQGQASLRDRQRWSHVSPGIDAEWQAAFVSYMREHEIEGCYWSVNPESGDTGGWYGHAYDPVSNKAGWGEWRGVDGRKTELLNQLWGR